MGQGVLERFLSREQGGSYKGKVIGEGASNALLAMDEQYQ